MRWSLIVTLVLAAFTGLLSAGQPLAVNAPALVVQLGGGSFKGTPSQLAWSPDSTTLCVHTLQGDSPPLKSRLFLVVLKDHAFHGVDVAPPWAAAYWEWKSARTAPGHPELVIEVQMQQKSAGIPTQSLQEKAKNGMLPNAVAAQNEVGTLVDATLCC